MKNIILCDIDGTVANNDHRQHFLEGKKDWDGFFNALDKDQPIYPIIDKIIEENKSGKEIIFLTGRPERYKDLTKTWQKKYFTFDIRILMRGDNNQRNKIITKKEIFIANFKRNEIDLVIDNDEELIKMWESFGLSTLKV